MKSTGEGNLSCLFDAPNSRKSVRVTSAFPSGPKPCPALLMRSKAVGVELRKKRSEFHRNSGSKRWFNVRILI